MLQYDYKVSDKAILKNKSAYKYETPYVISYLMTHMYTNGTVIFKYVQQKLHIIYI